MSDDRLDPCRGKFADEGREHVVTETDRRERADGIHDGRGEIGHHAPDEHDEEAFVSAVPVDLCEEGTLCNRLFRCLAEVEAHEKKCNGYADRLRDTGEDDAGHDAEEDDVRRREDDGGREAERIRKEGEEEGKDDCPLPE